MDDEKDLRERMQTAVADAVRANAARLRTLSSPALVALLGAAAVTPVIGAAAGAGSVAIAVAGVMGSVGANILTTVISDGIDSLRDDGLVVDQVEKAVAARIEAAFTAGSENDAVRREVVSLFEAVDISRITLSCTEQLGDEELRATLIRAFAELSGAFGEFASTLMAIRADLCDLRSDLGRQAALHSVERETVRLAAADLDRVLQIVNAHERRLAASGHATSPVPRWSSCPYRGLRPFQEAHAAVFYGRRSMTARLLARVREQLTAPGLLLVVGPSGAGKSSLLNAGLLGGLAEDGLGTGSRAWPRAAITPAGSPVTQLATRLAGLARIDAITVEESLVTHPDQAHLLVRQILGAQPPSDDDAVPPRLVLVIDQFEQLFTLVKNPDQQQLYMTILTSIIRATDAAGRSAALVVIGIRGDFLDHAMAFAPIRAAAQSGVFAVTAMTESELRESITGPAAEAGVVVPADLVDTIVGELRERDRTTGFDSGALPLLSQMMFLMWPADPRTPPEAHLTVKHYRQRGGVADVVSNSADSVYHSLTVPQRDLARQIFRHLCVCSDGVLTARAATRATLDAVTGTTGALDPVLESFAAKRLLTLYDGGLVDIAHEELLRSWTALHTWIQPDAADQALCRALAEDAQAWQDHGHDPSYLYRGTQLVAVRAAFARWAANPATSPRIPAAAPFLAAAGRRDQRRRSGYRLLAAAMGVLLAATTVGFVLAQRNAEHAEKQRRLALSRQLATQSRSIASTDRTKAQQLAAAALYLADTDEARDAADALLTEFRSVLPHAGYLRAMAFNDEVSILTTVSDGGTVRRWDLGSGIPRITPLTGRAGPIRVAAFSVDGTQLAVGGDDGMVQIWNLETRQSVGRPIAAGPHLKGLAVSPDGTRLVTTDEHGIRLWNANTGSPVGRPCASIVDGAAATAFTSAGGLLACATHDTIRMMNASTGRPIGGPMAGVPRFAGWAAGWAADGLRVAVIDERGLYLYDPASGRRLTRPVMPPHDGAVVAFSPGGEALATGGADGSVHLWDTDGGMPVGNPMGGHGSEVSELVFSPRGDLVASYGVDGTVRVWNVAATGPLGVLPRGRAAVMHVAFSRDGSRLAAGDAEGKIWLYDPRSWRRLGGPWRGTTVDVTDLAFSPDGNRLVVVGVDRIPRILDARTGTPVVDLSGGPDPLSVVFIQGGNRVVAVGADSRVRRWDALTGRVVDDPPIPDTGPLNDLFVDPTGTTLVTSGMDGMLRTWRLVTGEAAGPPIEIPDRISSEVAFDRNGTRMMVVENDGTVRAWNIATGEPIVTSYSAVTRTVPGDSFVTAALDPTSSLMATEQGEFVQLWDPASGRPAGRPMAVSDGLDDHFALSPDGLALAGVDERDRAKVTDLTPYRDPVRSLCAQVGDMSSTDWLRFANVEARVTPCEDIR